MLLTKTMSGDVLQKIVLCRLNVWYNNRMNSKSWWDYFDENPYEKVGRHVPSVMGVPIIVRMARVSWVYLDWLAKVEKCNIEALFSDNEKIHDPNECNFDEWMEGTVQQVYLEREKEGLPRPDWCPPANPADLMDI